MHRNLITLIGAMLVAIALVAGARTLANAPAINPGLRVETVLGGWRVPVSGPLFHQGAYRLQVGHALLESDIASLLSPDGSIQSEDAFLLNNARAIEQFSESTQVQPGNVGAWSSLAWARLVDGDIAGANAALATSWELAPYSLAEAQSRLQVWETLRLLDGGVSAPSSSLLAAHERDLVVLEKFAGALFEAFSDPEGPLGPRSEP